MALQNEFTSSYGTLHDEAYTKINFINVNCYQNKMDVMIETYGSKGVRDAGSMGYVTHTLQGLSCEPTSSTNIVEQAYDIIKHYPEYTGSLDV